MTRRTKRALNLVAIILASGLLALNVAAYMQAYRMMHFSQSGVRTESAESLSFRQKVAVLLTGVNVPRSESTVSAEKSDPPYQRISIPLDNSDIRLGGWYSSMGDCATLVLLFHGYASEKTSMLREAAAFRELGLSVLLVDFRGSGESTESYTTIGYEEAQDVSSAVEFAEANLPHSKLILFGQSMGAVAILRSVEHYGVSPDALIIESVFDRLLNTIKNRFRLVGVPVFPGAELVAFWGGIQAGFNAFEHNPVEYAKNVSCPVLFLHGTNDLKARIEEGRRVFDVIPSTKVFVELPHCGHESLIGCSPEKWKAAVTDFLDDAVLCGQPVS